MRILIVEDERLTRKSLEACIRSLDYGFDAYLTAENGRQAYELFVSQKPELVLTDIRMPGGDGIELAQRIYETDRNAAVIFLTAYSDLEYLKQAIHLEAVDYILKPVMAEELYDAIKRGIEKAGSYTRQNMDLLRENFLRSLFVKEEECSCAQYRRLIKELGFPKGGYRFCIMTVNGLDLETQMEENEPLASVLKNAAAGRIINRVLNGLPFSQVFAAGRKRILCLCAAADGTAKEAAETFRRVAVSLGDAVYENCFEKVQIWLSRVEPEFLYLRGFEGESQEIVTFNRMPAASCASQITGKDRHTVERINEIIAADYSDPSLKVNDIAEKLCYTSAYLCMVYRKVTGTTINDSIHMYRIRKAKQFLDEDGVRIYEAAVRAGYGNENYFSKVFRKYEGISPKEYRYGIHASDA